MQNKPFVADDFEVTYAVLRPYLGRVLLSVNNVDWRDLVAAGYVLDDVREALDACSDFVKREGGPRAEVMQEAVEHVFQRLISAEDAPAVHRPHAGARLARDFAEFVATYFIQGASDTLTMSLNANQSGMRH